MHRTSSPPGGTLQVALDPAQNSALVLTLSPPQPYRALLVWPRVSRGLSFRQAAESTGSRAYLPPLGLLTVAGLCPSHWHLKLVDEALESVGDRDLAWCDLVLISATQSQGEAVAELLHRARDAGRKTIIGGPYAGSHTRQLAELADHVVVGEVDEHFFDLAEALEAGRAEAIYDFPHPPDLVLAPIPRYDLLKSGAYSSMSLQTARAEGLYRTKTPQQLLRELDALRELGWKGEVLLVDDNFAENPPRAAEVCYRFKGWQERHHYPVYFCAQASSQIAQDPGLIDSMVEANFQSLFLSLDEPRGFDAVVTLLRGGLRVKGGFLAAEDSGVWHQVLEQGPLPWADFAPLVGGWEGLQKLYSPGAYFQRVMRGLELWRPRPPQTPAGFAWMLTLARIFRALLDSGPQANFRGEFGKACLTLVRRYGNDPIRLFHGLESLISSRYVLSQAQAQIALCRATELQPPLPVSA